MHFSATPLAGACLIDPNLISDERGFFARTYCRSEFEEKGLNSDLVQCNISFNKRRGTLRGMHYQKAPYAEAKLVRCTQGAIYDVIIDLRSSSQTYTRWYGVELTAKNRRALYVPEGFAHGFLTLEDNTEILYQMSEFFHSDGAAGVRHNDPAFAIEWPANITVISERDANYSDFHRSRS